MGCDTGLPHAVCLAHPRSLAWQFSSLQIRFTHEWSCARGHECASFPKPPPQRLWPEAAAAVFVLLLRFRLRGHIWPEEEGGGPTQAEVGGEHSVTCHHSPVPQGSQFCHQGGVKQRSGAGIPLSWKLMSAIRLHWLSNSVKILAKSPRRLKELRRWSALNTLA